VITIAQSNQTVEGVCLDSTFTAAIQRVINHKAATQAQAIEEVISDINQIAKLAGFTADLSVASIPAMITDHSSDNKSLKKILETKKKDKLKKVIGLERWKKLSESERNDLCCILHLGCSSHKANLMMVGFTTGLMDASKKSDNPPVILLNKNQDSRSGSGTGGVLKLVRLAGLYLGSSNPKKSQAESGRYQLVATKEGEEQKEKIRLPAIKDSKARHLEVVTNSAEILLFRTNLIEMMQRRMQAGSVNNLVVNILKGLTDRATVIQLQLTVLFGLRLVVPYFLQSKKNRTANHMIEMTRRMIKVIEEIIAEPKKLLSKTKLWKWDYLDQEEEEEKEEEGGEAKERKNEQVDDGSDNEDDDDEEEEEEQEEDEAEKKKDNEKKKTQPSFERKPEYRKLLQDMLVELRTKPNLAELIKVSSMAALAKLKKNSTEYLSIIEEEDEAGNKESKEEAKQQEQEEEGKEDEDDDGDDGDDGDDFDDIDDGDEKEFVVEEEEKENKQQQEQQQEQQQQQQRQQQQEEEGKEIKFEANKDNIEYMLKKRLPTNKLLRSLPGSNDHAESSLSQSKRLNERAHNISGRFKSSKLLGQNLQNNQMIRIESEKERSLMMKEVRRARKTNKQEMLEIAQQSNREEKERADARKARRKKAEEYVNSIQLIGRRNKDEGLKAINNKSLKKSKYFKQTDRTRTARIKRQLGIYKKRYKKEIEARTGIANLAVTKLSTEELESVFTEVVAVFNIGDGSNLEREGNVDEKEAEGEGEIEEAQSEAEDQTDEKHSSASSSPSSSASSSPSSYASSSSSSSSVQAAMDIDDEGHKQSKTRSSRTKSRGRTTATTTTTTATTTTTTTTTTVPARRSSRVRVSSMRGAEALGNAIVAEETAKETRCEDEDMEKESCDDMND
jgi:hypothetical protein